MMSITFEDWWRNYSGENTIPENTFIRLAYEAGVQSRHEEVLKLQGEVDELQNKYDAVYNTFVVAELFDDQQLLEALKSQGVETCDDVDLYASLMLNDLQNTNQFNVEQLETITKFTNILIDGIKNVGTRKLRKEFTDSALESTQEGKVMGWISVDDRLPEYGQVVLVYCGNSNYKWDSLKCTVAAYQSAKEIFETSEIFDSEDEAFDSWIAEVSLFDSEYGGRFIHEDVTYWQSLPEPLANM